MICARCNKDLPESSFDGLKTCKTCKEYRKKYYKNNRKQEIQRALKSYNNKYESKPDEVRKYKREAIRKNPQSYMLYQTKARAKRKGISFNLTIEDIIIPEKCPILGMSLVINDNRCGENSPTIDRIDPEKGYTKGNVQIISHKANSIKNNANPEELEKVATFMRMKRQ